MTRSLFPVMRLFLPLLLAAGAGACADRGLSEEAPISSKGPRLDVRSPARGSILQSGNSVEIKGTVSDDTGIAKLTVNGNIIKPSDDGSFTAVTAASPGITLLHTVATDKDGNQQSDTRAVLSGNLVPVETAVKDALVVNLDRNAWRIAGELAGRGLAKLDVEAMLKDLNPLVNLPVPCLGARVDIEHVRKGAVKIQLTPVVGGLEVYAEVDDIDVGLKVDYDVGCNKGTAYPQVTAKNFSISGTFAVSVDSAGALQIDTSDTLAGFEDFKLNSAILPSEVTNLIEEPIGATMATLVAEVVKNEVPKLLGGLLTGKDQVMDIEAETVTLAMKPTAVWFDQNGGRISLDTKVVVHGAPGTVYPASPSPKPTFPNDAGKSIQAGISDDVMNQVLASLWGAGIFDLPFEVDKAGSYAGLGVLFDRVEVAPRLPPVVTALPNGGGLKIALGDVEANFIKAQPGQPVKTVTRLSVSVETTVTASVKDNHVTLVAAEPVVWLDVLTDGVTGANPFNQESVKQLGSFAAKNLVDFVTQMVGEVPIPAVEGMTIVDASATTGESAGGYLLVTGNVDAR